MPEPVPPPRKTWLRGLRPVALMAAALIAATVGAVAIMTPSQAAGPLRTHASAINKFIGYENAAAIAKKAHKEGTTLKEMAVKLGYVTPEEFNRYKEVALSKGFRYVESGPMVRSSYHAEKHVI